MWADKVKRGDIMGLLKTGRRKSAYYEVFKDGKRINPINFYYGSLTAEEFADILRKAGENHFRLKFQIQKKENS